MHAKLEWIATRGALENVGQHKIGSLRIHPLHLHTNMHDLDADIPGESLHTAATKHPASPERGYPTPRLLHALPPLRNPDERVETVT